MGRTKHASILAALEMRAMQYQHKGHAKADQDKILYDEAVDETGTIDTAELSDSNADSYTDSLGEQYQINLTAATLEMEEITGVSDEILEVHGIAPGRKVEGVSRLIYENIDGLNNKIGGNKKLDKAKEIIHDLEADMVAINEHRMNCSHKLNRNGMSQMFNGGECEVRSVTGHNIHEKKYGKVQRGGTGLLLYGPLIQQQDFEAFGKDNT